MSQKGVRMKTETTEFDKMVTKIHSDSSVMGSSVIHDPAIVSSPPRFDRGWIRGSQLSGQTSKASWSSESCSAAQEEPVRDCGGQSWAGQQGAGWRAAQRATEQREQPTEGPVSQKH